ncbi:MAG: glycosyltransferase [Solirubrobacterales bacterium]
MASTGTHERPPGPSMLAFWSDLIEPLIDSLLPEAILEIGADLGTTTRVLLEHGRSRGIVVHSIDPEPKFDVDELEREYPEELVFHRGLSLEVLPTLEPFDLALIDGDHNWYTVLNELLLLERRAGEEGEEPPVVVLHDIGWPYGRRDLYYDPEAIPADKRWPFERKAIHPDHDELVDEGINAHLANARKPAPEHSGVVGAIEDFIEQSDTEWKLFEVAGEHGLGVLAPAEMLEGRGKTADLLASTADSEFLRKRIDALERARIDTEIRRVKASQAGRRVAELEQRLKAAEEERAGDGDAGRDGALSDELEDTERRLARLKRQRDAAEEREDELEEELAVERRKARRMREEVEVAEERHEREAMRLVELEAKAKEGRSEVESATAAREAAEGRIDAMRAELEEAIVARSRLVADFEEGRESLERTIDDLRGQADTGRHAAAELCEMLEDRELEVQRLNTQMVKLQTAVGRARADAEIAQAESSALERRLQDLAARHESLIGELGAAPTAEPSPVRPSVPQEPGAPEDPSPPPPELAPRRPSESERDALTSFTAEYQPLSTKGADPLAQPSPQDRRGYLRAAAAQTAQGPSVDVVVAVHDALEDVRRCLWSLVHKASYPFRLIVVNDGSDAETSAYLAATAAANPEMTLIENDDSPHGYTIAANLGMRESTGDYAVLLNSDTIVTHGWLERIIACGESDERIGILGPLSNAASHQSVPELREAGAWATNPLPVFANEDGVGRLLERVSERARPRLPFINGFCYVVKRPVFDRIGYFDEENFASGYCEENDFSYRARQAGFELAVVDDCYVFHAKSKSYSPAVRKPIAKRNYEIFQRKHGAEKIDALVEELERDESLKPLRYELSDALSSSPSLIGALDAAHRDPLDVAFILPGLGAGGSGGSHSVYQEVKGLRELGLHARIMLPERAWKRAVAAYDDADDVFETFADPDELAGKTESADVVSATHFKSVAMLADLRSRRDDFLPAYYVQDYEPFFTSNDSADIKEAVDSYTAVPDCLLFAKTHWLCNIVGERHRLHVAKVEPSIDEQLFKLGDLRVDDGPLRVVAMVRPRTPRRQPTATVAVLEAVQRRFGEEVELVTFGCGDDDMLKLTSSVPLLSNHQGILSRPEVATLLNRADVFLDMSLYQAFGRTALEAMACGCTAIVPRLGGVWEFVEDGVNAVAVETLEPDEAIDGIAELIGNRPRVRALQAAGRLTAERYSICRAALSEYLLFSQEHARRFGRDRAVRR